MSKRLTNWITAIVLIAALFFGYRFFFVTPAVETEEAGVVTTATAGETIDSNEFLALLLSVQDIKLSKAIFDNAIFRDRLKDFGRELPDRLVGRSNPFAPFGVGRVGTTTTNANSTLATTTAATSTKPNTGGQTGTSDNFETFNNETATSSTGNQGGGTADFSF